MNQVIVMASVTAHHPGRVAAGRPGARYDLFMELLCLHVSIRMRWWPIRSLPGKLVPCRFDHRTHRMISSICLHVYWFIT